MPNVLFSEILSRDMLVNSSISFQLITLETTIRLYWRDYRLNVSKSLLWGPKNKEIHRNGEEQKFNILFLSWIWVSISFLLTIFDSILYFVNLHFSFPVTTNEKNNNYISLWQRIHQIYITEKKFSKPWWGYPSMKNSMKILICFWTLPSANVHKSLTLTNYETGLSYFWLPPS